MEGGGAEVESRQAWCGGGVVGNGWKLASVSMKSQCLVYGMETQIEIREVQTPFTRL